jgi:hypothetical protein
VLFLFLSVYFLYKITMVKITVLQRKEKGNNSFLVYVVASLKRESSPTVVDKDGTMREVLLNVQPCAPFPVSR